MRTMFLRGLTAALIAVSGLTLAACEDGDDADIEIEDGELEED